MNIPHVSFHRTSRHEAQIAPITQVCVPCLGDLSFVYGHHKLANRFEGVSLLTIVGFGMSTY